MFVEPGARQHRVDVDRRVHVPIVLLGFAGYDVGSRTTLPRILVLMSSGYDTGETDASLAQIERSLLADLLEQVGPDAPTLCTGWDTRHLVAHLVVREGTPLGPLKIMRPNVANEEIEQLIADTDYAELVDRFRGGPPRLSLFGHPKTDQLGNSTEFFIHHEDVRRATPDWTRRDLPQWAQNEIWSRTKPMAKMLLRKSPVGVGLQRTDTGDRTFAVKKLDTVMVTGLPSEIALFTSGRTTVAQVDLNGEPEHAERLRSARLGF